jgi:hypothetical protein
MVANGTEHWERSTCGCVGFFWVGELLAVHSPSLAHSGSSQHSKDFLSFLSFPFHPPLFLLPSSLHTLRTKEM